MDTKQVVNAQYGLSKVPDHYFFTRRQSGLPWGYYKTWRDYITSDEVVVLVVVLCFVVGCMVMK